GDQIADFGGVILLASGLLDLAANNKSELIGGGGLTMNISPLFSSEVRTGTGTLTLFGGITANVNGLTSTATPAALISANLGVAENIDDAVQIGIDGTQPVTNGTCNVATSTGSATGGNSQAVGTVANANPSGGVTNFGMGPLGDGWHDIIIRMQNGTAGAGPV